MRVVTRNGTDGIAITSSASTSSEMRIAPELRGEAAADGRRQRDGRDQRGDLAGVEVGRYESGEGAAAELVERLVALQPDLGTGEERQEADDADRAADHGERAGAEADLGQQPDDFAAVPAQRSRHGGRGAHVEQQLFAQVIEDAEPEYSPLRQRHVSFPSAVRPGSRWP